MKHFFLTLLCTALACLQSFAQNKAVAALLKDLPPSSGAKTEIIFLGSAHLGQEQFFKAGPGADMFSAGRQKEIAAINNQLAAFRPDIILIEAEPQEQAHTDSLYAEYKAGRFRFTDLAYGRAERYQFGFALAKKLQHPQIVGVDHYESVSNRMLVEGSDVERVTTGFDQFSAMGANATRRLAADSLSLTDYLLFLNTPQVLDWTYQTLLVNPLRVQNGAFRNPPPAYVDTAFVSKKYIGAEFASIFYERDLKITSNIIVTQQRYQSKRMLVIMGQRHAALLSRIFAADPSFTVVPLSRFLH